MLFQGLVEGFIIEVFHDVALSHFLSRLHHKLLVLLLVFAKPVMVLYEVVANG